jgi:SNF2 family DNA or RNA helicase
MFFYILGLFRIRQISKKELSEINTVAKLNKWLTDHEEKIKPTIRCKGKGKGDLFQTEEEEETEGDTSQRTILKQLDLSIKQWANVEPGMKFQKLQLIIEGCVARQRKSVIYCPWVHPLHILRSFLWRKYGASREVFWLTGEQAQLQDKQASLASFKESSDRSAILLAVPRTGGVGIDILEASVVVFLSLSWNPQLDMQCVSRCWRKGM